MMGGDIHLLLVLWHDLLWPVRFLTRRFSYAD